MSAQFVTFNAWVGNRDPRGNLYGLADDVGAPLAIAGQELKRYRGSFPGYERVDAGAPAGDDAASTVLFVRKRGATVIKPRLIRVDGPRWKGPKHGEWRDPRTFVGSTVEDDDTGCRWDVMAGHRTPGGPNARMQGAAESWEAEHRAIVEWVEKRLDRHHDRPIALLFDWNQSADARGPLSVHALAKTLDGQLLIPARRPPIDGAILINCRGKAKKLPGSYGGDGHLPVVITATKEKP